MKIKKTIPFVLALLVFIISNFVQNDLSKRKKSIEGRISVIEKSLTNYLQYNFISTINLNFGQHYLNGVMENTVHDNEWLRKNYMTLVIEQLRRALSAVDESLGALDDNSSRQENTVLIELNDFDPDDGFDNFLKLYSKALENTKLLQSEIKSRIDKMGEEKLSLRNESVEIGSKEKVLLNITIALNFLILLYSHLENITAKTGN